MRVVLAAALALAGCRSAELPLFVLQPPESTGVAFVNALPEDSAFNIQNYLYYYNGGGVAAGDIDGDGLPDLYLTSNLGSNRLYLNKGGFRFEDITARAGVADSVGWKTGVAMADVNGDGRLDIYVSGVSYLTMHGRNVLYVNNGDQTFTDRTKEYGLAHVGYSTQAAFFDYDGDGDLDMYLLNHSVHTERGVSSQPQRTPRHPRAGDRLFRNEGGHFVDVSERAHIYSGVEGYGLGVVASDLNLDGCPDLYIANDFQENDFLYWNNCDGTFTESIARAAPHTSRFSMGVDAADFNNDGRPDLVVLDMLPDREEILKTSANAESFNVFNLKLEAGYHAQYARNTLLLNRGGGLFSDIGYLAGVYATDWSWAPLFADLDNDGYEDLFITNGIYRRPNDLDYITYQKPLPQVPLANYAFRNNGDLTFTNMADSWGLARPGFSNGAAYVDLDNDGALDLVVNNINDEAFIYRNNARTQLPQNRYLQVRLEGDGRNRFAVGAKVTVRAAGRLSMQELAPTRGFQSSVDYVLTFGLGAGHTAQSVTVEWPDGRVSTLTNVAANQRLTLRQADAKQAPSTPHAPRPTPLFTDVTAQVNINFKHAENVFYDYNREPLMPHVLSTEGPALAVGDVNGDGLDDIYMGGAKWQPGRLFVQQRDGTFRAQREPAIAADSLSEDVDAAFFDADGDGHLDLYVVSGGNEFWANDEALRDRLYINDGRGSFLRAEHALPDLFHNGSCVVPGDFNGDGHIDLFVGSRVVARQYGRAPRSYLLQNDGTGGGRFTDVTAELAPGGALAEAGMVSAAAWVDDALIVVGEWMPVRMFRRENGKFVDRTAEAGLAGTNGWWNSVTAADVNGDGRMDLVLGNLGLNSYIRASRTEPARLYVNDFFGNGTLEQILTFYKHSVSYPIAGRDDLVRLIPQLRSKYPSYAAFGASRIEDIIPATELARAVVLEARDFRTSVALNKGNGTFELQPLPTEAQFAPVYAALADDFDRDGHVDLLLGGNFYGVTPVQGRYDASYGQVLRGDGTGRFEAVDLDSSGLVIEGQVRHMARLQGAKGERLIVVARNGERLQVLRY